jgi:hypothetical protein
MDGMRKREQYMFNHAFINPPPLLPRSSQVGVPEFSVKGKMAQEGVDPNLLEYAGWVVWVPRGNL